MPSRSPARSMSAVELQAVGEHLGAVAELAAELFVAGDLAFPFGERGFPIGVGLEERGEVPGVLGFDLAARGEGFGFGH